MPARPWRITMLGGLAASRGDEVVTRFETRKTAALLACLALDTGRAHSRELLAEELWPDEDPAATRGRLRQALSALRQVLEPAGVEEGSVLRADRAEVQLVASAAVSDVAEFRGALRDAADAADEGGRAAALQRALSLYTGELLPGFCEDTILQARSELESERYGAVRDLSRALAGAGDLDGAIEWARRLVASDPLREDAHCELMRLCARAGRIAEAVRQYRALETVLHDELGTGPSAATRAALAGIRSADADAQPHVQASEAHAGRHGPGGALEPEGGAVPLDSPFYILRPTDDEFEEAIARRDSIVLVKGPRQTGKTSLLARGLQQARAAGAQIVLTDLQKLTAGQLASADALFRTLGDSLAEQLDLAIDVDAVWNHGRGWNVNYERFVRREVLGRTDAHVVWGLDEADRLFEHPFGAEVFALFRSWHNERSLDPDAPWSRLTLAIAYATEAYLFIADLNQSPFNVGTRLTLADFTLGEVTELNRRYGQPLSDAAEIARFHRLLGGHPYMVRRGLHALTAEGLDLAALEAQADGESGPFADHLRRVLASLTRDGELSAAVQAVLRGQGCPTPDAFCRLRSAGLLIGEYEKDAQPRCQLYARYLGRRLL